MKELDYFEFVDEYQPIENHIDMNAAFDGMMFETYGNELEFVRSQNEKKIWTILEGDEGETLICPGYHLVNRIGYMITKKDSSEDVMVVDE